MRQNKKAISEMVSYILLIVIAMSIAIGVYSWLKIYVPAENTEKCAEETAIAINDFNCTAAGEDKILTLTIENKGLFNIQGFFARASNDSEQLPSTMLEILSAGQIGVKGRYDFPEEDKFKPGEIKDFDFIYTDLASIKRVQIQPFIRDSTGRLLMCTNIADVRITGC